MLLQKNTKETQTTQQPVHNNLLQQPSTSQPSTQNKTTTNNSSTQSSSSSGNSSDSKDKIKHSNNKYIKTF